MMPTPPPPTTPPRDDEPLAGLGLDDLHAALDASPVHALARDGDVDALAALLHERPTEAAARDKYGLTPLHWAAERGHAAIATLLVGHGADANALETRLFRRRPLHFAAMGGDIGTVQALLASGAEVDVREYRGWTALHYAIHGGHGGVAQVLRAAGADAHAPTLNGGDTDTHCRVSPLQQPPPPLVAKEQQHPVPTGGATAPGPLGRVPIPVPPSPPPPPAARRTSASAS